MAQEYLTNKSKKAMHLLKRSTKGQHIRVDALLKLFDALMTSIATYGEEVWFPFLVKKYWQACKYSCLIKSLLKGVYPYENMHINFCKFVCVRRT